MVLNDFGLENSYDKLLKTTPKITLFNIIL